MQFVSPFYSVIRLYGDLSFFPCCLSILLYKPALPKNSPCISGIKGKRRGAISVNFWEAYKNYYSVVEDYCICKTLSRNC